MLACPSTACVEQALPVPIPLLGVGMVDSAFVPIWRDGVGSIELDGEVVVLDTATNDVQVLGSGAAVLWAMFDGAATVAEIAASAAEEFGEAEDLILQDTIDFIEDMRDVDLVCAAESRSEESTRAGEGVDEPRSAADSLPAGGLERLPAAPEP